MADAAVLADDGVCVGEEVIPDLRAAIERNEAVQNGIRAKRDVFVHKTVRPNVRVRADFRGLGNHRCGVNSWCVGWWLIKKFDGASEGEVRICGAKCGERWQAGLAFNADAVFDEDGRRTRAMEQWKIAAVGEKGHVARSRVVHAGNASHFGAGVAFKAAGQFLGKFSEFHLGSSRATERV